MIVYNLTDRTPPWERSPRTPNKVKLWGKTILPGDQQEFPNHPLSQVIGLINAHMVSVDGIPGWYQEASAKARRTNQETLLSQITEPEGE